MDPPKGERPRLELVVDNVISLPRRRACDIIKSCVQLLDQARAGRIRGFMYVVSYDDGRDEPGVTGVYGTNRTLAVGAAMDLVARLQHNLPDE